MALFNAEGQGVAVFSPASTLHWNFGPHAGGHTDDPEGGPCMHVAPLDQVALGPGSEYRYRYWLAVGTGDQLAEQLDALWEAYSEERAELNEPIRGVSPPRAPGGAETGNEPSD
jgi:hypothetical protein